MTERTQNSLSTMDHISKYSVLSWLLATGPVRFIKMKLYFFKSVSSLLEVAKEDIENSNIKYTWI